ncbi:MAG TPA: hypothetical protein VHO69_11955 [Phototrophicaceae bacterium]|nr:hypothetical protein [Phototrophicaceae bacterium]
MAVSVLRCEPCIAENKRCDETDGGWVYSQPLTLWRVFVDDECIATEALPFSSDDSDIELRADKCFPYFGEGHTYISARHHNNQIWWFGFHNLLPLDDSLPTTRLIIFDVQQYVRAIQQAQNEPEQPNLPNELLSDEIQDFLKRAYPKDAELPLYRYPDHPTDPLGRKLHSGVWEAINNNQLHLCDPPQSAVEVRVGLDMRDFAECVWQVGRVGDEVALFFEAEPHLPLWVSGFASAFRQEMFLDTD